MLDVPIGIEPRQEVILTYPPLVWRTHKNHCSRVTKRYGARNKIYQPRDFCDDSA